MSRSQAEILREALSLSPSERAELAERLLSSLDAPDRRKLDSLWAHEVEDRLDAYEQGRIATIPAEHVFDQTSPKSK